VTELPDTAGVTRRRPRPGSIGDLLSRLVDDIVLLVSAQIRLAGSEFQSKAGAAAGSLAAVAVGAMLISVAMLCLLGAGVAFLAQYVGIVAAALIVAAVAAVIGGGCIYAGINHLKQLDLAPRRSIAMLKRSAETLKGE
jgi:hypothetical protein